LIKNQPARAVPSKLAFFRTDDVPELYAASDDGKPPAPGSETRWFLLPRGARAKAVLTLGETWAISGTYLFLEEPLPERGDAAFANAAWRLLNAPSFTSPRIAWFSSAVPVHGALQAYVLSLAPGGVATSRSLHVPYRNYAIDVEIGVELGLLTEPAPVFTLAQTAAHAISFSTSFGATTLNGLGSIAIPLQGDQAGALQFPLQIGVTNGVSDLIHLDIGMRAFYPTPDGGGLVSSLSYPLLDTSEKPGLLGNFAPWSAAADRTYFAFAPSTGPLQSCYSTVTGRSATLAPMQDGEGPSGKPAHLVLAARPSAFPPSADDLYTFVPEGDFLIAVPESGEPERAAPDAGAVAATKPNSRFICGLSGVEYIGLAEHGSGLSFFPGGAAYAEGFDPNATTAAPTRLTTDATTAWALPCSFAGGKSAPLIYFAQPDGSVLFQPTQAQGLSPLVYLEAPANLLPATIDAANAVPLLPYAGVASESADLKAYKRLEKQVVSPSRRATIAALGKTPPQKEARDARDAGDVRFNAATPQGLLATFVDQSLQVIDELVLAQMPGPNRFSLRKIAYGDPLRTALASNQLFLVLSNPDAIAPYLDSAQSQITIEGWAFALDSKNWILPGVSTSLDTAMVFKFAQGRLVDLLSDTGAWAKAQSDGGPAPNPFNRDDAATSARLSKQVQDAIEAYDNGDSDFASFVKAVTDPTWQGILFFNVETPLTQLPDQCKGLAVGIDPKQFRAHHVAIEIAKIEHSDNALSVKPSSMFALINYSAAPNTFSPTGAAYQFQVQSLKILFVNSAVSSFSSVVKLMIRELFGDQVAPPPEDSILYLYGALQRQTIAGVVYDTYLFQTPQDKPLLLAFPGNVFNAIQISSAQFVTELDDAQGGLTHAHFALAGFLDFRELELDAFSFGREASGKPAGLQYAKLLIRMAFDPAGRGQTVFAFDAGSITLDPATSFARANSLYNHFPASLSGILQADAVTTPGGAGFLGVQSPLTQSALELPWYGLVLNVDLGTLGALAAKAGFVAQLIAAWSPSDSDYKVFVGLKLPGSDGGKGVISIEGVLNMAFRAIVLGRIGEADYFLLLNALTLKVLSVSFPPGGQIDMALFGNPTDEHNSSLGWYAAYTKDQAQKQSGAKDRRAHAALRETTTRALTKGLRRLP